MAVILSPPALLFLAVFYEAMRVVVSGFQEGGGGVANFRTILLRRPIRGDLDTRSNSFSSSALFCNSQPTPSRRVLTIPVLGPIPGAKPLVVGEDYVLEHPTPMQWKILEESTSMHRCYLKNKNNNEGATGGEKGIAAGIDAAPLVAFMDEVTSLSPIIIEGERKNFKYATIAAVVGISTPASSQQQNGLDTSSNDSFMESIMKVFRPEENNSMIRPSESTIRLIGIGRAALSDFHSRLPSTYYEERDERQDDVGYGEDEDDLDNDNMVPILMAQFRLLLDSGVRSSSFVNQFDRSRNSSPVHALNEMNRLSNRITSLHEDRKHLVRGLRAAKARLAVAGPPLSSSNGEANDDLLEDHDGLGQLSSGFLIETINQQQPPRQLTMQERVQIEIDSLLNEFPSATSSQAGGVNNPLSSTRRNTNSLTRLLEMENYGMGISSASFSAIPGLTSALAEKLSPYYSPETQATEEHYYEVFSFMGVSSLSKFVASIDLEWALKCTNTIERMQWVYEHMWVHKKVLREASEEVSDDLRDCGEECTDLW